MHSIKNSFSLITLVLLVAGCSKTSSSAMLPDTKLQTLTSATAASVKTCPTKKCLTVYVAPWCHYCRAATPMIIKMRDYLTSRGVTTRIIVGLDQEAPVRAYAANFGPDTWLDPRGAFAVSGGVPHFFVSDNTGVILKEIAGYPEGAVDGRELASYFDLP